MDISNGRLGFTQDLDNQKFLNALRQSTRGVTDFNIHLQNNFNQSLVSVNDLAKGVTAFLTIDMARDFVSQMVKIRGEFEQTEIAFNTMLQSREKGNALMQEMVELAKNTPMQFSEVSQGAKQLLAYQVEAEKLTETLSMLGDISSGLGVPMSRLILVYGQVRAKGRLMGDDLRQFTEAGVPMIAMIAKNMGVAQSAVADMVSEGKVGFKEVEKVLEQLTSQGGLFYNMMEEQSKTIPGQIAKLQDEIEQMFNSIGKDSQGFVTSVIGGASSVVENYEAIGKTLGVLIGTYGAYKAALITVSSIEAARAKTVANEIANLSISEKMQLGRLAVTQRQAQATLASAEAELVNNQAILTSMRAEVSSLAIKKQKAISSAIEARNNTLEAQSKLANARAELTAIETTGTARQVSIAQKKVEKLENAVIGAQEKESITRKTALGQTQVFNNAQLQLENQAKKTNIAQTALANTQESVSVATKNLNTASTARLTLAQHAQALSAKAAATWQAFLNATMLNNPIVAITAVVGGLIAAYFILRDTTTAAEKAQEAYNKTQEDVKSKLDETKQKAEEYINVLKDETATVYQQLQAYKALQLLKLKGIENLTQEQIATMDLTELRKLLNAAYDDQSLESQRQKLSEIGNEIDVVQKKLDEHNKTLSKGDINTGVLQNKVDELTLSYDLQLAKVKEIEKEQYLANLPLRDRAKYWEDEVNRIQNTINEIENTNTKHTETKSLLGSNVELSTIFKTTLNSVNITPLLSELQEAKKQFSAINAEMGGGIADKKLSEYNYYDFVSLRDKLDKQLKDIPKSEQNTEKYKNLLDVLRKVNKEIDSYSAKEVKPKKPKTPKKSDDPVEIYKKQVSDIEKQYEQYLKILDSNDVTFATEKAILKAQLSSKGASYEEYLRAQQKELIKTAKTSDVARKKLLLINEELLKLSKHSELQIFKDEFEKQLDDLDSVIEKLYEVQDLKESLRGKSDPLSIKKIEFIDEKQKELLKDSENAARSLFKTLTEESKPLDAINKKFDAQLFLLKNKILNANEEISKLTISANSSPEGSDERIKTEEKILKLKKEILDTQNLIDFNENKRTVETKNVTNDVDYNKLISEYQSYADKIKAIEDKLQKDIATAQKNNDTARISQINKQANDEISNILKDQLMNSEEWAMLFSNMDEMSVVQIDNLIKEIESKFNQLKGKFNPIDLNAILKQLRQARKILIEKNPFGELAKGFADLFTKAEEGTEDNTDSIVQKWDRVQKALDGSFEFIDDALKSTGVLKDGLGETAKAGLQAVTTTISSALAIKATVKSAKEGISALEKASVILAIISAALQAAQAIARFLSNIFSKDKKKEKQIKNHQKAVDDLTNSYKDLEDAAKRALGSEVYSNQKQMIENLKQQQIEYQKMIELEKGKKKKDAGKIKEWEDALRDSKKTIQDLLEEIAEDVVQTNAKDLATELGDALVEAFGKGEDAAKAFAEVANNVLKNAVLNQLKKQFLEKQLQAALDKLYKDMGGDDEGNFNFNGLSPEEQQAFRDKIKEISQNFSSMLGEYSDLFKDLTDPNESAMAGAIKGMSEETGNALLGQFNAIRILQKELVTINIDSNKILLKSLDRLANIDYNTRSVLPLLEKLLYRIDNAGRAYGF